MRASRLNSEGRFGALQQNSAIRRWWWVAALFVVGLTLGLITWGFGPDTYTLEGGYTDHLKHEYDSWAFLQEGFNIYVHPVEDWEVAAKNPHVLWEQHPHPYPFGAVLLFLPFGVVANLGAPDLIVHWVMVTFTGLAAIWAVSVLYRTVVFMRVFLTLIVGVVYIHWGLNGFFDPLVAAIGLLAVDRFRREDWNSAVVLFTGACLLHYRAWFLVPLALVAAWRLYGQRGWNWRLTVASVSAAVSIVTFIFSLPSQRVLGGGEGLAMSEWLGGDLVLPAAVVAIAVVAVVALERNPAITVAVASAITMIAVVPQFHAWYLVLLTPLFAMAHRERTQAVLAFAYIHTALVVGFPSLWLMIHFFRN